MVLVKLIELYKSVLHEFCVTSALMNRKGLESTFTVLSAYSYQTFSPAISDIGIRFHLSSKKSLFRLTSNPCFNSHPSLIIFCCWDLIYVSLASEDANSKLVDVITVADVDTETHVNKSLVQIWKLKFGHKVKFLFRLWAQSLVKMFKLKFRWDFEAEVWSVFCCWCWKLKVEARFGQDFKLTFSRDTEVWLRFWS